MAILDNHEATLNSSKGLILKTAGKYIPYDISVALKRDFTINSAISSISITDNIYLTGMSVGDGSTISILDMKNGSAINNCMNRGTINSLSNYTAINNLSNYGTLTVTNSKSGDAAPTMTIHNNSGSIKIDGDGDISTFAGDSGNIEEYTATKKVGSFKGTISLDNEESFTGSFTAGGVSLTYDKTNDAVVFTYE